ncbi:MAG: TonB-dependent receptor [Sterolibacteriaceae bacterium]|nr:TonB-dependent receptor [Candidatus Methylophosphatis haderslevensis]
MRPAPAGDLAGALREKIHTLARIAAACLACAAAGAAVAGDDEVPALEDLLKAEVTSVARKPQALADTPAAVYVITADDIARSGATSIPEALRLAPGVNVARISNAMWAVTIRGFNGRFANKLLVMIDGRSVYSPLFSGTLWEAQDTLLEDIDRIEVIRGPGAAMWGANAVNGVINIITKRARATQGTQVVVGGGTTERAFGSVRHGLALGDDAHMRLYAKGFAVDSSVTADGSEGRDEWRSQRAGMRYDRRLGEGRLTLLADTFHYTAGDQWVVPRITPFMTPPYTQLLPQDQASHGASASLRYEWSGASGAENALQTSFAHSNFGVGQTIAEDRETIDLDFQQRIQLGKSHDVVWGLGYRHSRDQIDASGNVEFAVPGRSARLAAVFVRDEITLVPQRWHLTLGTRFEHDSYTGFDAQPDLRLRFSPDPADTLWAAISRAVRTPSRGERDAQIGNYSAAPGTEMNPMPLPALLPLVVPESDLRPERLTQLDLGWRKQFSQQLAVDLNAFYGRFRDTVASRSGDPSLIFAQSPFGLVPVAISSPVVRDMRMPARTKGLELSADWRAMPSLRLQGSYSLLSLRVTPPGNPAGDSLAALYEGSAPRRQWSLRAAWDVARGQRADLWLRCSGALPPMGIPGYTTLDLRYAWRASENIELSLTGQNLLDSRHPEYVAEYLTSEPLQAQRGVYLKARLQF